MLGLPIVACRRDCHRRVAGEPTPAIVVRLAPATYPARVLWEECLAQHGAQKPRNGCAAASLPASISWTVGLPCMALTIAILVA